MGPRRLLRSRTLVSDLRWPVTERFFTRRLKERSSGFSGVSWCHHSHGSRPCSPPCARCPPPSLRPWAASFWLVLATGASLSVTSRVRQRAPGRRGPAVRVLSRAVCAVGPRRSPRCGHPAKLARVAALALRLRARIASQRPKRRRVRVRAVPCPPMRRATAVDSTPAAGSTGRPLLAWVTRPCAGTTGLLAPSHGPPPASRAAPLCLHSALSLPCTSVCSRPRGTARLALAGRSVGSCPSTPPAATNADRLRSPATAVTPPQPRSVPPLQCAVPASLPSAAHPRKSHRAAGSTGRPLLAWVTRPCAGTTGLLAPSHGPPPASQAAPLDAGGTFLAQKIILLATSRPHHHAIRGFLGAL